MCFSAGASFGTGVVLTLIGVAATSKIAKPSHRPFAMFPYLFALQQFVEGIVWLSFSNPVYAGLHGIPTYAFLTFSHIIWPVWIPLSVLLLEKDYQRRKIIWFLLASGIVLAIYHIYCLLFLSVTSRTDGHHIQYIIAHPRSLLFPANGLYALATVLPFFISSVKRMWWIGLFIVLSYVATFMVYKHHIVSVWCFFATFICVFVYLIVTSFQKVVMIQKES